MAAPHYTTSGAPYQSTSASASRSSPPPRPPPLRYENPPGPAPAYYAPPPQAPAPPLPPASEPSHDAGPSRRYSRLPTGHQTSASPRAHAVVADALASDFPSISVLPKEDLQDLLSDPHYFAAVFEDLPQVRRLRESQAELISADESLIEKNNALKPRLEGLRDETSSAFSQAHEQIARWRQAEARQAEAYKRFGSQPSYSRLLTAHHDADRASERVATDFVDNGAIDEDEFVAQFKELRKLVHKRGIVLSKWGEGGIRWEQ